ncbi:achaete-scute homolog 5 [Limanda limanda]|uniref:achaete-scute homolog 5 n=1 Tax=Limanda limanda TaxID=27771 RepID=UPI0029C7C3FA|nr:achaete-scute homolog 5 [Limanda limanda]
MMSYTFSRPITEQHSSHLSFSLSPPAGLSEDVSQPSDARPFLVFPSRMDAAGLGLYRGPLRGPGLLPYLPPPFHHHGHFSVFECPFEPAFIQKRNERERQRVKCVNQGYAKLRDHLPGPSADKRLSKVETLRAAIRYIQYLQGLVALGDGGGHTGDRAPNTSAPGPD